MATAQSLPIIGIFNAATKEQYKMVRQNTLFKMPSDASGNTDIVVGDLYRTPDLGSAIVVVHKIMEVESIEAILKLPNTPNL